jgi:hypothetical protein
VALYEWLRFPGGRIRTWVGSFGTESAVDLRIVSEWRECYVDRIQKHVDMSIKASEATSGSDLLRNSSLYREFQAEREEILKHKWIESEKAGYDIGFERALTDWIIKHRSKWRKSRQSATR